MMLSLFCIVALIGELHSEYVYYLSDEYINELNNMQLTWKAGRNFVANLTEKEIIRMFGEKPNGIPESPKPSERRTPRDNTIKSSLSDPSPPPEFDSRKHLPFKPCHEIIGYIPNQGACASAYAFAITSVASDRLCLATKGKQSQLLSAEYVAACCKMCRYPKETEVCSSGLSSATWAWIHKRGLVTGGEHKSKKGCQPLSIEPCNHASTKTNLPSCNTLKTPKPKCHTRCTNDDYEKGFFQDKHRFKKFYWLTSKVVDIQREIIQRGPVVANIYIYTDFFNYKSGVYTVSPTAEIKAYSAVKILGWGEENNVPYWIVATTFGPEFGDHGIVKIRRGRNEAIIEELVNAAVPRGSFSKVNNKQNDNEDEESAADDDFSSIEDNDESDSEEY